MQLNTTDIGHHFGIVIPSALIADTLGIPPAEKVKKGSAWNADQLPAIAEALSKYLIARAAEPAGKKPKAGKDTPEAQPAAAAAADENDDLF